MNILWNAATYQQDLETAASNIVHLERLKDSSILITGATGLVGSYMIDTLLYANTTYQLGMTIYGCGRNVAALEQQFSYGGNCLQFIQYDVNHDCSQLDIESLDYIVHAASNSHPATIYNDPVGTITANVQGTKYLLDLAKRFTSCRLLFISSGEIYGVGNGEPFTEDYVGYLDITSARFCYPISKRCAENLCVSYHEQYQVDTVIARLCHTFGANNLERDSRASAQFMKQAIQGEDIVLNSMGGAIRSYSYISDSVSGILSVLTAGESANAYNISNGSEIAISELAEEIGRIANVNVTYNITNSQASPFSYAVLDNSKLKGLGWSPKFTVPSGLEHTFKVASSCKGSDT